jgi:radical SAM protein with 4Fe4S-binding SPASM domain
MEPKINNPQHILSENIIRKKPILDKKPNFYNGIPVPSWIELSLIDACNRSCVFCPKSNEELAPNTYQKMEMVLIDKLVKDLKEIDFNGAFCLCGYGEPLLHKDHLEIINKLGEIGGVEIITNGDTLNSKKLTELYNSRATRLLISLYDGDHQIEKFNTMITESKIPKDFVILRDRWYSDKKDYGVKLTNRTQTISVGNQESSENFINKSCYYTAYQVLIDWDGNFYLCPQDWRRKVSMGNIMQLKFFDIWNGNTINKYRKKLLNGNRDISPCNKCNAEGTVYGESYFKAWEKIINK